MTNWRDVELRKGERDFLEQIIRRYPQAETNISCRVHREGGWTAHLQWPSPVHTDLMLTFFLSGGDPSIQCGPWHAHVSNIEQLWPLSEGVLTDQFVVVTNLDGPYPGSWDTVDFRFEEALLNHMTGRGNGCHFRIRSFAGTMDAEIDLDTYETYILRTTPVHPFGYCWAR